MAGGEALVEKNLLAIRLGADVKPYDSYWAAGQLSVYTDDRHDTFRIFRVYFTAALGDTWDRMLADLRVGLTYRPDDIRLAATYHMLSTMKRGYGHWLIIDGQPQP